MGYLAIKGEQQQHRREYLDLDLGLGLGLGLGLVSPSSRRRILGEYT